MGGEPTAKRIAQKGKTMTTKEFLNDIINGNPMTDEHIAKAQTMLESVTKERKPSKAELEKQAANDALKAQIVELLSANGVMVASDIAEKLTANDVECTTSKASSMCRQLVDAGVLQDKEVKVPKRGKVKGYFVAETDAE